MSTSSIPRARPNAAQGSPLPEFYSGATERFGCLSEGFCLRRLQPFTELTDADRLTAYDVKFLPQARAASAIFRAMVKRESGCIITTNAIHAHNPHACVLSRAPDDEATRRIADP